MAQNRMERYVGGIRFNIPAGFEENESLREVDKFDSSVGSSSNIQVYGDEDNNMSINVTTFKNKEIDEEFVKNFAQEKRFEKITINDVEGYLGKQTHNRITMNLFCYTQLKKLIIITTTDKELLDDIVVSNDDAGDAEKLPPVQSKSNSPQIGRLIYGILGLILTLLIMSGAASGNYVLRGTNSSEALFYFCFLFLLGDFYYIYTAFK